MKQYVPTEWEVDAPRDRGRPIHRYFGDKQPASIAEGLPLRPIVHSISSVPTLALVIPAGTRRHFFPLG